MEVIKHRQQRGKTLQLDLTKGNAAIIHVSMNTFAFSAKSCQHVCHGNIYAALSQLAGGDSINEGCVPLQFHFKCASV